LLFLGRHIEESKFGCLPEAGQFMTDRPYYSSELERQAVDLYTIDKGSMDS